MKWSFEVQGEPPSWNHAYKQVIIRRNGVPIRTMAKTAEAQMFQAIVTLEARFRRPKGWEPKGQLRITYDFWLKRDKDADNMIKMLNDSVADALGVNDRTFLPCVRSKTVSKEKQGVLVEIEDCV